jgi:hypothetical protein
MGISRLTAVKLCGCLILAASFLFFMRCFFLRGSDISPLLAVALLVIGVFWWLKAVPRFSRQFAREDAAKRFVAKFKGYGRATGEEKILHTDSLRLRPEPNRFVWLTDDDRILGSVVGTHEMGRIWVTANDSGEHLLFQLSCKNPGAWYHYGYRRKVRWFVSEWEDGEIAGEIELRPTFLGRFKWPIRTKTEPEFGQVKAGVEWRRILVGPAGALAAAVAPNLEHHGTVFICSAPLCAISWSGRSAALTFANGEWDLTQRKLAIAAAVLLAFCPNYYRHA